MESFISLVHNNPEDGNNSFCPPWDDKRTQSLHSLNVGRDRNKASRVASGKSEICILKESYRAGREDSRKPEGIFF